MRHDRTAIRFVKLAVLLGVLGLVVEGLFELKLLIGPLTRPPSVPGQSKIIEHFVIQHVAFPAFGLLLAFRPAALLPWAKSRLAALTFAVLALLVSIPEVLVSRTDLFRPYPFDLRAGVLKAAQMVEIAGMPLNTLQLQHLLFAHGALMGMIVVCAAGGAGTLRRFAGPRTGEGRF